MSVISILILCLSMLLRMSSLSISSEDLSRSDCIDLEAGGPVNRSQNDPGLILRVILHYRYNCTLCFKPRWISLIGVKWFEDSSDLGRAFAGIWAETIPHLDVE